MGKYRPEKNYVLDTFQAVESYATLISAAQICFAFD